MIVIFLRAIKRAELAIDVADVRVIDVAIDDVGDDLVAAAVVTRPFARSRRALASAPKLLERPSVKLKRLVARNAFARKHFLTQRISRLGRPCRNLAELCILIAREGSALQIRIVLIAIWLAE